MTSHPIDTSQAFILTAILDLLYKTCYECNMH